MNGDQVSQNLTIESSPVRGNHVHIPFNGRGLDGSRGGLGGSQSPRWNPICFSFFSIQLQLNRPPNSHSPPPPGECHPPPPPPRWRRARSPPPNGSLISSHAGNPQESPTEYTTHHCNEFNGCAHI